MIKFKVKINNKPYPIPVEMRPLWRISLIIIICKIFEKNKKPLNLKKLTVLLWLVIRDQEWANFKNFIERKSYPPPFIASDEANYIAIEIGFQKNLISYDKDKVKATDLANDLYENIVSNNLFNEERDFVELYLTKLSNDKIEIMLGKN